MKRGLTWDTTWGQCGTVLWCNLESHIYRRVWGGGLKLNEVQLEQLGLLKGFFSSGKRVLESPKC